MATNTKIEKNGKEYNYYRITRTIGHQYIDGKKIPVKKQFTGSSKAAAERKYEEWKDEQRRMNTSIVDDTRSFGDLANYYVQNILLVNSKYSIGTRALYEGAYNAHVKNHPIRTKNMASLRPEDIQLLYNSLDVSAASLNSVSKFIKGFVEWSNNNKYSNCNLDAVILPIKPVVKIQSGIVTWDRDEIENIMNVEPGYVLLPLLKFAYYSGMRISELLGLKWIDFEENIINVRRQYYRGEFVPPKGGKERVIPMHKKIKDYVSTADRKYDLVFTTQSGNPLDYHNVIRSIDRFYKRNGITKKKFHAYRASFITGLCSNGVPIQTVAKLAGHENINVTAKYYASISAEEMLEAINRLF